MGEDVPSAPGGVAQRRKNVPVYHEVAGVTGLAALMKMFRAADATDIAEGALAYERYHIVMQRLADHYGFTIQQTCAVFCALSPNSDYRGNLRSTASVLHGLASGTPYQDITVSTYKHCRDRALLYATGVVDFMGTVKGHKTRNFYMNIMDPSDPAWVTIDGHMSAIWQGRDLTMKDALIKPRVYKVMADDVKTLAEHHGMLPHQMQAVLWFTRKRTRAIKYDPQASLFAPRDDLWATLQHPEDIQPYPTQNEGNTDVKRSTKGTHSQLELIAAAAGGTDEGGHGAGNSRT